MAASVTGEQVQCARPGCAERFPPGKHGRKFCSGKCKSVVQAYKLALQARKA